MSDLQLDPTAPRWLRDKAREGAAAVEAEAQERGYTIVGGKAAAEALQAWAQANLSAREQAEIVERLNNPNQYEGAIRSLMARRAGADPASARPATTAEEARKLVREMRAATSHAAKSAIGLRIAATPAAIMAEAAKLP